MVQGIQVDNRIVVPGNWAEGYRELLFKGYKSYSYTRGDLLNDTVPIVSNKRLYT